MATKYSKYQIAPMVSQYVASGAVPVITLLRERFEKNKASKDLIDRTLDSVNVMPGDTAIVTDTKKKVREMLGDLYEQGNYEDAGLVIQDAASYVEGNKGLQAAIKSNKNRQAELDFIREQRMKGAQILDFGQGAAAAHTSYYFDKESETFVEDIYEPRSEMMLDYDAEMAGLLKTIKADTILNKDGTMSEGITIGKADQIAALMYGNYIQSEAGIQDMRRLMELELPQNLPQEERARLAKNDIMKRLRGFTRQYVYNKVTAPKGGAKNQNAYGGHIGVMNSGTVTTKGMSMETDPHITALDNLKLLLESENKNDPALISQINLAQVQLDKTMKKFFMDNNDPKGYEEWKELKEQHTSSDDQKFFELTRMLVAPTNTPDTSIMGILNHASKRGLQAGGATAAGTALVNAIPGFGQVAYGTSVLLGTGVGFGYGIIEGLISGNTPFRNVRDWHRGSEANNNDHGGEKDLWNRLMDSEEDQLMEELFGDEDPGDMSVEKLNKHLGTSYTEADLPRLQELASAHYTYMAQPNRKDEETGAWSPRPTGDMAVKNIKENGYVIDSNGWTTAVNKDGKTLQGQLDFGIRKMDPSRDFTIMGAPYDTDEDSNYSLFTKDWSEKATITDIYEADPLTNTPLMMQIKVGDQSRLVTFADDANGDQHINGGFMTSVSQEWNMPNLVGQEKLRRQLQALQQQQGQPANIGQYIDMQAAYSTSYINGDEAEYLKVKRSMEDQLIVSKMLLAPDSQYAQSFPRDKNDVPYIVTADKQIPWIIPSTGQINLSAWEAYQRMYPELIANLRAQLRTQSLATAIMD